ncbi:MAG: ATP-dependent zinc metalloprotease FtsH [Gemmataceae bacterium]|nr:ATP-dependent zinc metalloprotease FtsH [Gemmataceae bacterium]
MPARQTPPPAGPKSKRPGPVMPNSWIWLVILATVVVAMVVFPPLGSGSTIAYSDFRALAKSGKLSKVTFTGNDTLIGELKDPNDKAREDYKISRSGKFNTLLPPSEKNLADELRKDDPNLKIAREEGPGTWIGPLFMMLLPTIVVLGIIFLFLLPRFRDPLGGGILNNYIKSPARRYDRSKMRITFDDVADMQNAKRELREVVEFLKSPEKFQRLGAVVPKGVLLVGPPGTGKTLLSRAVAGEAGVPFYSINGSEFIQMFVGVGASRVRDLFKTAKENAPCLIFIDEIDAVGRMRGAGVGGGSDEREQTLNQILSEMDGFQPTETVIVIAATNRPDVLDPALLRPGRFDRHVTIDRPTWQGRLEILKVHTRNKPLGDNVNLEMIARRMIGMTGADLRNLANEAALLATTEGKNKLDLSDFERAADRVLIGPRREEMLSVDEKKHTAYHEAGHTLVTWLEPGSDRPLKVSIIPRGQALGVTWFIPEEERYDRGQDYFKSRLIATMGGRAADRLMFGQPYAGHENDLKQATKLARYMVTHWGMSERLGPMSFRIGEEHVFLGKEIQEQRDFSEGTARIIDEEVQKLLREADARAFELLEKNRTDLELVAETLLQREELQREEIDELLKRNRNVRDGKPVDEVFAPVAPE